MVSLPEMVPPPLPYLTKKGGSGATISGNTLFWRPQVFGTILETTLLLFSLLSVNTISDLHWVGANVSPFAGIRIGLQMVEVEVGAKGVRTLVGRFVFSKRDCIGEGSFGSVFKGIDTMVSNERW